MTPEQLKSAINRGRTDPVVFSEELLGMSLHDGQKEYIKMVLHGVPAIARQHDWPIVRRFLLSCANRWGKSAVISIIQLWYLFYKHGVNAANEADHFHIEYRTANIAPFASLTEPVFKAMKQIMTSTYPVRRPDGTIGTNKCQIEWFYLEDRTLNTPPFKLFFINNSYIEHLSLMGNKGDSLQGKPYGIITYDEAARSDHLQLEIDDAITGRLLDWTAPLHLLSTPAQDSSSLLYYHRLYEEGLTGRNASYTQEGSIYENTFFTKEQIEEQERMLEHNPLKDQVLHGKFIFGTNTIFPTQDIIDSEDESLNDGIRYQEGHKYVIGVDTAIGSDEMVYQVLDVTEKPYRLVWEEAVKGSSRSPQLHTNIFCNLFDNYHNGNNIEVVVETFNGESMRFYDDLPPYIKQRTRCIGTWQPKLRVTENKNKRTNPTAKVQKAEVLVALKKILAEHNLRLPANDYTLLEQLRIYKEDDKRLPTDRLMALAMAVYLAEDHSRAPELVFRTIEI